MPQVCVPHAWGTRGPPGGETGVQEARATGGRASPDHGQPLAEDW